jgi:uncharacterized tellurite resistance protein B-like protein/RNA polymerase subunit RPABC4/transcription elongation factor Spt4
MTEPDEVMEEEQTQQVAQELEITKEEARQFDIEEIKGGQWFLKLLQRVFKTYDRNANAAYFKRKYPGLPPDEVADKRFSVAVRMATIAGGVAGAAATADQIVTISSVGITTGLLISTLGAEMIYLVKLQMKLVLDLATVYDMELDPEDPEDILMIFGYALGVAPVNLVGRAIYVPTKALTVQAVRKYISKGTLKAVQDIGRKLGVKILQRTIIKYAVPAASIAVGSSYNYVTTKSIGRIAKAHLKNRGQVTDELRALISREQTYTLTFPAAAMYIARLDGEVTTEEMDLFKGMLSRMQFDETEQVDADRLMRANEGTILAAIAELEEQEEKRALIEVLVLMAIADGDLQKQEREFLSRVADQLNISIDLDEVETRAEEFKVEIKRDVLQRAVDRAGSVAGQATGAGLAAAGVTAKALGEAGRATGRVVGDTTGKVGEAVAVAGGKATKAGLAAAGATAEALGKTGHAAGQVVGDAAGKVGEVAAVAGGKAKTTVGRILGGRKKKDTLTCPNCGETAPPNFRFCPACGASLATEKECAQCGETIPVSAQFCPMCGTEQ